MAIQVPRVEPVKPVKLSESNQSQEAIARMNQLMQFFIQTGITQENMSINKELSEMGTIVSAGAHAVNVDQIDTLLASIDREAREWKNSGGSNIVTDFSDTSRDVLNVRRTTIKLASDFKKKWIRMENQLEDLYKDKENWGESDRPGVVLLNEMEEKLINGLDYIDAGTRTMFKNHLNEAKLISRGHSVASKIRSGYGLNKEDINKHYLGIGPNERMTAQSALNFLETGIIEGNTQTIATGIQQYNKILRAHHTDTIDRRAAIADALGTSATAIKGANDRYGQIYKQNVGNLPSQYLPGTPGGKKGGEYAIAPYKLDIVGTIGKGVTLQSLNHGKMQALGQIKQMIVNTGFEKYPEGLMPKDKDMGNDWWSKAPFGVESVHGMDISDANNIPLWDAKIRELINWSMSDPKISAQEMLDKLDFHGTRGANQAAANILNGLLTYYGDLENERMRLLRMPYSHDPSQSLFPSSDFDYGVSYNTINAAGGWGTQNIQY